MVEANANFKKGLDIKLSLDLSAQRKSPVVKRVQPSDYDTLLSVAKKMASKHGLSEEGCKLKYNDGESFVVVEDDDDLEMAYAIAQSGSMKLMFLIKHPDASAPADIDMADANKSSGDEEMKEEPSAKKPKREKKEKVKKEKGLPRKALKNLINSELDKQAQDIFKQLLKSDDLPAPQMNVDEANVVHTNVECDGCGVNPIVGPRYKSVVDKNFDYCGKCEDRLGHEHAMLKITKDNGAPDVMIAMLGETEGGDKAPQEEAKDPMTFVRQMYEQFAGGHKRGGRGGHGGRGGGCGGRGGRKFQDMFKNFVEKLGEGNFSAEDLQQKFKECSENWGQNFHGKQPWKEARAVVQKKPEDVIEISPGMTKFADITVLNDTYWPWKPGCTLALADE